MWWCDGTPNPSPVCDGVMVEEERRRRRSVVVEDVRRGEGLSVVEEEEKE